MKLSLLRQAMILVLVPLAFELLFVGTLFVMLQQVDEERAREAYAREVTGKLNTVMKRLIERHSLVIMNHLSESDLYSKRFESVRNDLATDVNSLKELVKDHPHERDAVNHINQIQLQAHDQLELAKTYLEKGDKVEAAKVWFRLNREFDELLRAIDQIVSEQTSVQIEKKQSAARLRSMVQNILYCGVAVNVLIAVMLALFFNRNTVARLKVLLDNSNRLAEEKPLNPELSGGDELAVLDKSIHNASNMIRQARQKERAILDNSVDVICSLDKDFKFTSLSLAVKETWGYFQDELIGKPFASVVREDDRLRVLSALQKIKEEKGEGTFECAIRTSESEVTVSISAQWSEMENSMFCVAHDISQRAQLEKVKQEFVAMVSHDLKVPLTSIRMVHKMLADGIYGPLSESGKARLHETDSNIARLIDLINGLLEIEKMESANIELSLEKSDLESTIESAISAVSGYAEQQKVPLKVKMHNNPVVMLDSDRMVRVLVNLLSNAIKASPQNMPVRLECMQKDNLAEISVTDRGHGIADHIKGKLFEKFKSGEDGKTPVGNPRTAVHGTGLGLAICKLIVERHGGEIGVNSVVGQGSTFFIRLPLA